LNTANIIAIFDLDGTLTVKRSLESSFISFLLHRHQIPRDNLLNCALFFLQHIWHDPVCATKRNKLYLKGIKQVIVEKWVQEFLRHEGDKILHPEGIQLVNRHHELGHVTVLLTGSLGILVRPLCDFLSLPFSRIYATELEINGDSFSGYIKGAHYYGEEKNNIVKYLTKDLVPTLDGSFCYADSASDIPIMHSFGHPIAVNPDKKLESAARKNNWEIIFLGI
jgi:HAD superfamily hydrolase (TIGR01490 family)